MNPTEPNSALSAPTPPVVGRDLVEYVRGNRETSAYILFGLSVLFLVLTIWTAVNAFRTPAMKAGDKPAAANPMDQFNPDKDKDKPAEISNPKRVDWLIGAVAALSGFLVVAAAGAWFLVSIPPTTEDRQRSEARQLILGVGGLLGALICLVGLAYFYQWSDALSLWLDKDEKKQARYVLIPLVTIVFGAGVAFLAAQPARAEERNNAVLRRLVYGTNFALTVLLVLVMLVVGNVVFALKAPNMLDTTESGFYTLSDTTKTFLQRVDQPMTAYLIIPDSSDRVVSDIRQVLNAYHEASNGRFSVRFVSPVSDKQEIRRLGELYPKMDKEDFGILLVAGPEDQPKLQKHGWIKAQDLFTTETTRDGKQAQAFAGEGRLLKEVRILSETDTRPVLYFTQSNGEMALANRGGPEVPVGDKSIARLQQFLESSFSVDVKPLTFAVGDLNPQVPADATAVVVVEPTTPLSDVAVNAIRKYMAERKGKLIVLAGATPNLDGRGMALTGLESLLNEYNVDLGRKFIYTFHTRFNPRSVLAKFNFSGPAAQNPIVQALGQQFPQMAFPPSRTVTPITTGGGFQATTIMQTLPNLETWLEDDQLMQLSPTMQALNNSEAARVQKQFSAAPRPLMVAVTEPGGTGRVVVIGNAFIVSDDAAQMLRSQSDSPPTFNLVGVSIDWLRDRPPLPSGVENKVYKDFNVPDPVAINNTRLLYLPLGLGMAIVIGLGVGVWAVRRR